MNQLQMLPGLTNRQFMLIVRRISNCLAVGTNNSIFFGSGLIFLQSRAYLPGDPVRSIDWRLMARTGRPFVKEYETQTHTPVYIVVDDSASMTFSASCTSKYAVATLLAGGMAFAALSGGNPVSVMSSNAAGCPRPTFATNKLTQDLRRLRNYSPTSVVPLGGALAKLRQTLTCRSFVVVLSDLHDECAARQMKSIALRHEAIAVQLADPMEAQPIRAGFVRLGAAEGGESGVVTHRCPPASPPDHSEALRRAGVQVLHLRPERAFDPQVRAFLRKMALRPWKDRGSR